LEASRQVGGDCQPCRQSEILAGRKAGSHASRHKCWLVERLEGRRHWKGGWCLDAGRKVGSLRLRGMQNFESRHLEAGMQNLSAGRHRVESNHSSMGLQAVEGWLKAGRLS
jgi:hypothetical protein